MKYIRITSPSNPHIRDILSSLRKRPGDEERLFLVEGIHLLEMALSSSADIREIFFTNLFRNRPEGNILLDQSRSDDKEIKYFEVSDQILGKLTETETPQGIAALVSKKALSVSDLALGKRPFIIVLDKIQDPGNLGTIIRTADASGADAVIILPGTCDVYMQKTIRSTAGSIFNIPVVQAPLEVLVPFLQARGIKIVAASTAAEMSVFEAGLDMPLALVFGNEARGLSSEVLAIADLRLKIPVLGGAESLNVASSAAICIYETVRQRLLSR
jgi:TrmH family RNA methyltransferase